MHLHERVFTSVLEEVSSLVFHVALPRHALIDTSKLHRKMVAVAALGIEEHLTTQLLACHEIRLLCPNL